MSIFNRKKELQSCDLGRHDWVRLDALDSDATLHVTRKEFHTMGLLKIPDPLGGYSGYIMKNLVAAPTFLGAKVIITNQPYETKSDNYLTCSKCSHKVYLGKVVKRNKYY